MFSGNYGGALGAASLAKGIEGNKSLKVAHLPKKLTCDLSTLQIIHRTVKNFFSLNS